MKVVVNQTSSLFAILASGVKKEDVHYVSYHQATKWDDDGPTP
jgi:hypothetical protein